MNHVPPGPPGRSSEHSPAELDAMFRQYRRTRDRALRNQLVTEHRWLAQVVARKLSGRGEPVDDLVQVATIGVLKAVERFDPELGVSFRTYASVTAMGEIRRHFRDTTWSMRVARSLKERYLTVSAASEHLAGMMGRSPTVDDLARYLMMEPDEVIEALWVGTNYRTVSIVPSPADAEGQLGSGEIALDADTQLSVGPADDRALTSVAVRRALAELPERERRVVYLRYFRELTQSEIAAETGISQVHVSRLLRASLRRLRACFGDDLVNSLEAAGVPDRARG